MPHGKGRAIPKVSRLGTRFFAHPPGQPTTGAKESDLHLSIKAQSLIGARAAGWDALPEQSGTTPDGHDWRADVLCRRPGKAWTVAVEAQVQLQGEEAYRQRQERYAASGIRALWLVAHEPAALHRYWREPDPYLPAFKTTVGKDRHGRPEAQVQIDGLSLAIPEFVSGALSGQLHWSGNGRHGIIMLVLHKDQCWHRTCRKTVLLAYRAETLRRMPLGLEAAQAMTGYGDAYARARAVLPDLADNPWPLRNALASRCPHCRREIRYHSHDWAGQDVVEVPIGVDAGEQGRRLGVTPHAQWHWGPESRWTRWAPLGGIGLISHRRLAMRPRRLGPGTG
ncbi:hypothetical protein [Microvirga sp. KLBC 81]|uniref:hypothetical protein n=1 Tax=Microvirga sp. KLBC 81 TaxID=1862707 RepID=UPI001057BD91|nr:hypothetical protein [Microvirga sp. KLBC 81]